MKRMCIGSGTCVLILVAFVLLAGCTFLQTGNPPAQTASPTTVATPGRNTGASQTPEMEVAKTCPDIGGNICLADETCTGTLIKTTDSSRCCSGACTIAPSLTVTPQPTPTKTGVTPTSTTTIEPTQTQPQVTPTSIITTQSQQITPTVTPTSGIVTLQPTQTWEMQLAKTCPDIGGNICLADETCSGSLIKTTDSSRCCAGTCILPILVITPTQTTQTQVVVPSVSRTCDAIGGNICQATQTCTGGFIQTTDSSRCCAGTCLG